MNTWLVDMVSPRAAQLLSIDEELYRTRSPFQEIRILSSPDFGRMLVLDDAVQTTERDEFIYHEMLAHVPLVTHPRPRRAAIIGGGDGGLLEEVLKHPLDRVVMVEIDREVVEASRRFLPGIAGGAFEDPRASLVIADGPRYLRETGETFDVIMVDSTDPKGPGMALFSEGFYADAARALGPDGILCVQSGSAFYQRDLLSSVRAALRLHFAHVATYLAAVPSYPGALWSFTLGSKAIDPMRAAASPSPGPDGTLRYYSSAIHQASFLIPAYLQRMLDAGVGETGGASPEAGAG